MLVIGFEPFCCISFRLETSFMYLLGVVKKLTPLLCVNLEIFILNYPSEPML